MKSCIQNVFLMLALFAGACQAISQDFVISSSPSVGVGGYPDSVVAADVNGDGKLDLISANYAGTLTVLTNNGSGGFVLAATYFVGAPTSHASSVTAADVNGDGKIDLICADQISSSSLTVLTNNGSGGFVFAGTYPVGLKPNSVVAADVNGDGKIDLISANMGASTLTVLTNNGSGGFALSSSPTVGLGPQCVVAADVNGDGKIDLISANFGGNTLTVLTNNGKGGFVISSSPGVIGGPQTVVAADLNGDGKIDLISVNRTNSTLMVLTNSGGGRFGSNATYIVGNKPLGVTAADVNGDGKLDLISANSGDNTLTVLTNDGSGNFVTASIPTVGTTPFWVVAADINGDGKLDLISANWTDFTLTVLTNNTEFPPPPALNLAVSNTVSNNQVAFVYLVYPWSGKNYTLLTTTNLASPVWLPATNSVSTSNGPSVVTVTISNTAPAAFYRLSNP